MTTYLGKSCSFCLPRVPSIYVFSYFPSLSSIYVFSYFPFGSEGRIWDLIVSVPDHCLSFYFPGELHLGGPKPNCHNPGFGAPILYKLPLLPPGARI